MHENRVTKFAEPQVKIVRAKPDLRVTKLLKSLTVYLVLVDGIKYIFNGVQIYAMRVTTITYRTTDDKKEKLAALAKDQDISINKDTA